MSPPLAPAVVDKLERLVLELFPIEDMMAGKKLEYDTLRRLAARAYLLGERQAAGSRGTGGKT